MALGLKQIVREPTRFSVRNGITSNSIIDMIFSNSEIIQTSTTLDINISDHQAVMVMRKKDTAPTKISFTGRSYKYYVREDFQELLAGEDWTYFYSTREPNLLWETMERIIRSHIDRICPLKLFKVNEVREP